MDLEIGNATIVNSNSPQPGSQLRPRSPNSILLPPFVDLAVQPGVNYTSITGAVENVTLPGTNVTVDVSRLSLNSTGTNVIPTTSGQNITIVAVPLSTNLTINGNTVIAAPIEPREPSPSQNEAPMAAPITEMPPTTIEPPPPTAAVPVEPPPSQPAPQAPPLAAPPIHQAPTASVSAPEAPSPSPTPTPMGQVPVQAPAASPTTTVPEPPPDLSPTVSAPVPAPVVLSEAPVQTPTTRRFSLDTFAAAPRSSGHLSWSTIFILLAVVALFRYVAFA